MAHKLAFNKVRKKPIAPIISNTSLGASQGCRFDAPRAHITRFPRGGMSGHFSMITDLPDGVFCSIFIEWLPIKWFCRFDAALCNKRLRNDYKRIIHSGTMIYDGMPIALLSQSESYFKWTLDRGIFTRACDIHSNMDSATIAWILHRCAKHLCWISCHNFGQESSSTVCEALEKASCSITKFFIIGGNWNASLSRLLTTQNKLQQLHLTSTSELEPEAFESLSSLPLKVLAMEKCTLSTATARVLAPLISTHLMKLSLLDCTLTDDSLLPFATYCTNLTVLGIRGAGTLTDAAVISVLTACKNLTFIDISVCLLLTDLTLTAIATHTNTKLERLYIHTNNNFSQLGVDAIAMHCINLDVLHCTACRRIPASSIVRILKQCPKMCVLYFGSPAMTAEEDYVVSVLQHCGNIFKLVIGISDASQRVLNALAQYCREKLTDLGLFHARTLHAKGLYNLATTCVHLELLVHSPGAIDEFSRLMWNRMNPRLEFSTNFSDLKYNILVDL